MGNLRRLRETSSREEMRGKETHEGEKGYCKGRERGERRTEEGSKLRERRQEEVRTGPRGKRHSHKNERRLNVLSSGRGSAPPMH